MASVNKVILVDARLTPIQVSTDGLRELGIEPAGRDKNAKLYSSAQFHELLQKLTGHLEQVASLANEARQEEAA